MRLIELISNGGNSATGLDPEIAGLTADSRAVQKGFLFAALPGSKVDGSKFIADAVAAGAVAILGAPGTQVPAGIALVTDDNLKRRFACMAASFYKTQPRTVVAVTGTNGKTSTASFARQIWSRLGYRAASLGTLGLVAPGWDRPGSLTTPDPVALHADLAALAAKGVTHVAMEASSHGLDQYRLDGVQVSAAAFTNLTRDHLDYHGTLDKYRDAKVRLFSDVLMDDGVAVLNADIPEIDLLIGIAAHRRLRTMTYGRNGRDLKIVNVTALPHGQRVSLEIIGQPYDLDLNLVGGFQLMNALAALGLVLARETDIDAAVDTLSSLEGVRGRLELAARTATGAAIYVDYAHTPDALETVLVALRPHATGKLTVVFGCGGDRDRGKRPQMAQIACRLADRVIVTDDNPRSEDPAAIRGQVLQGCARASDIGDREQAIQTAIADLAAGDVLLIAGKGHEQGQIIGTTVRPFDDAEVARRSVGQGATA
ncbi:UDP-N-acetylmuramoyl-L-alanyl-D-glutamate--2,6-diaminopimelate ligase [Roseiterribacter gracilis]|uniref:UDP-N-acetylmuramoyl-L-alanyl-D-glutamate--2,6-diaminopimelate ligase n=1 Tax=Roseiterribacter gracilis TaxID=2812848 RepID=A0A8S8XED4_9PROT|nr:UDP-N-acetylmuramoyl-L-alanyl-D-glutamate--2,6-diaminopimelate ligase [Rhodospirillales bacterium TMPK1]